MNIVHDCSTASTGCRLLCPEKLGPQSHEFGDELLYLCHSILVRRFHDKRFRDSDTFVPLKARYMENVIGQKLWYAVKKATLSIGMLECNDSDSVGRFSRGYRLAGAFVQGRPRLVDVEKQRLAERIAWHRDQRCRAELASPNGYR